MARRHAVSLDNLPRVPDTLKSEDSGFEASPVLS